VLDTKNYLEKIHAGYDKVCYSSLLMNQYSVEQEEMIFTDNVSKTQRYIDTATEIVEHGQAYDVYHSLNSFWKARRIESAVWHLTAIALDYDYYKIEEYKELTPEEMYTQNIKPTLPFTPTFVVNSGRGLYVLFCFANCSKKRLPLYKSIYTSMLKQQEAFRTGVDSKVSLTTQVIRVPGSFNSKSNTQVTIIEHNDTAYELTDFVSVLPYSREQVKAYKENKAKEPVAPKVLKKAPIKNSNTAMVLYDDLRTLIRLRNKSGMNEGYREQILFVCRYELERSGYSKAEALNYASALNQYFNNPLTKYEVENVSKPAQIFNFHLSIDKIISKLSITSEEQNYLNYLQNKEMKYNNKLKNKRNNRRDITGKTDKQKEIFERRKKVCILKYKGMSNTKIAQKLKASKQLIHSDLIYINSNKWEFSEVLRRYIRGKKALNNRINNIEQGQIKKKIAPKYKSKLKLRRQLLIE